MAAVLFAAMPVSAKAQAVNYVVTGDGIETALTGEPGNAQRGRALVADRRVGLCLLCHSGPFPEERFQGDLAPTLAGAGSRWTVAQLRLRMVDSNAVTPGSIMPGFHKVTGLARVGRQFAGKPVLDAQQIEDIVAFLATLKE
ncbi:MAG: sulfur oxidation c-type cytochrome SoxX [Beijerinckiaceae bacterium]